MSAANNVISLDSYRQEKTGKVPYRKSLPEKDSYFCIKCGYDQFKLYTSHIVLCGHCGVHISNLAVQESSETRAANSG